MRKLWNRPANAVWSLSTLSGERVGNMNICTYVTAVALEPKLILVAVYKGTQTLANIAIGSTVLLQLLTEVLAPAVRICGQQSGKDIHKIQRLQKRYQLAQHKELYYFADSAGLMELVVEQLVDTSGDHVLLIGRVQKVKNLSDGTILTTTFLRDHKYTR